MTTVLQAFGSLGCHLRLQPALGLALKQHPLWRRAIRGGSGSGPKCLIFAIKNHILLNIDKYMHNDHP